MAQPVEVPALNVTEDADPARVPGALGHGLAHVGVVAGGVDEHPHPGEARALGHDPLHQRVVRAPAVGVGLGRLDAPVGVVPRHVEEQRRRDDALPLVEVEDGVHAAARGPDRGRRRSRRPAAHVDEVAAGAVVVVVVAAAVDAEDVVVQDDVVGAHVVEAEHRPEVDAAAHVVGGAREEALQLQSAALEPQGAGADRGDVGVREGDARGNAVVEQRRHRLREVGDERVARVHAAPQGGEEQRQTARERRGEVSADQRRSRVEGDPQPGAEPGHPAAEGGVRVGGKGRGGTAVAGVDEVGDDRVDGGREPAQDLGGRGRGRRRTDRGQRSGGGGGAEGDAGPQAPDAPHGCSRFSAASDPLPAMAGPCRSDSSR